LLRPTNGVFQAYARTNAADPLVVRGFLLLSEAELVNKDLPAAEAALAPISGLELAHGLDWQRLFLLARIQLALGNTAQALTNSARLLVAATNAAQPLLMAETVAFHAGILESLGRVDEAITAYQKNLSEGVPAEPQRLALLKVTELSLLRDKTTEAADTIDAFITRFPTSPVIDLALLTSGELRLRQHLGGPLSALLAGAPTNSPASTNLLTRALNSFRFLVTRFPQSPLLGKAQLDLGWCYWLDKRLPESQAAWENAARLLPPSIDQATAYFKLADVQFQQKDYTNALSNYTAVVERFSNLPQARTNLFERALYQSVRAAIAAGDLPAMTNSLVILLGSFPAGFHADRALLLAGSEIARKGQPARAREIFSGYLQNVPAAPLEPQIRLAIARTFEQQNDWTNAIQHYDTWLQTYTNNDAVSAAEYYRAFANARSGNETNALVLFTNFTARFPKDEFTPLAQWWVADHFFRSGEFQRAEMNYQILFKSTNWARSDLSYEAQMMAGRSAYAREIWTDASGYFTTVWNDTNAPAPLRLQALFAYGDVLMNMDAPETSRMANYDEAIRVFGQICDLYPNSREAVLAWGQKAGCLLQWAQVSGQYDAASNAFQQVIAAPLASGKARSIATVGSGVILEKQAQQLAGAEREAALRRALDLYLDVLYGKNLRETEQADSFWTREAGLKAARLAESLQAWRQAIGVYQQMQQMFPPLAPRMEKNILKAQEQMSRDKT
jgi:TolA-binding protein